MVHVLFKIFQFALYKINQRFKAWIKEHHVIQITQESTKQKLVFKTDYRSVLVESIAECSKASILQYFRPSLSYDLCYIYL